MVNRVACTIVAVLFALGAFYGFGPTAGGPINLFGILLLGLAAFIWFGWRSINEGFNRPGIWDAITEGWLGSRDGERNSHSRG